MVVPLIRWTLSNLDSHASRRLCSVGWIREGGDMADVLRSYLERLRAIDGITIVQ